MKKEIIIIFLILLFIVLAELFTYKFTNKTFAEIESDLNNLKEEIIQNKNVNTLIDKTNKIYNKWEEKNEYLSYYLEHNELEKVNTQIILIKGYLESDTPQDSIPDLEECIYILEHIEQKQSFNLKNIF